MPQLLWSVRTTNCNCSSASDPRPESTSRATFLQGSTTLNSSSQHGPSNWSQIANHHSTEHPSRQKPRPHSLANPLSKPLAYSQPATKCTANFNPKPYLTIFTHKTPVRIWCISLEPHADFLCQSQESHLPMHIQ
jgi:hypothetical protein